MISAGSMTVITWLVTLTLGIGLTAVLHIQPVLRIIAVLLLLAPLTPIAAVPERGWMAALGGLVIIVFFLVRAPDGSRSGNSRCCGGWSAWRCWGRCNRRRTSLRPTHPQHATGAADDDDPALPALLMGGYAASQIGVSLAQRLGFDRRRRCHSDLSWR